MDSINLISSSDLTGNDPDIPMDSDSTANSQIMGAASQQTVPPSDSAILAEPSAQQKSDWTNVSRQRSKRSVRRDRKLRQAININDLFEQPKPYYTKMVNLKFNGININTQLDIITADDDLKKAIGTAARIVKASRNSLLIETTSQQQTDKLLNVKKIAGHNVEAVLNSKLNVVKGVVRSNLLGNSSEEKLLERLKDQGVTEIRRLETKKDNTIVKTNIYFLTFELHECPKYVTITDWHKELVEEYKEKPRQCFKCQRFSHVEKFCRREVYTCARCGEEGHKKDRCPNALRCFHCGDQHMANDRNCSKYKIETEILNTQIKEKTSRYEAMQKILMTRPDGERLYADVARQRPLANTSNTNPKETDIRSEKTRNNQLKKYSFKKRPEQTSSQIERTADLFRESTVREETQSQSQMGPGDNEVASRQSDNTLISDTHKVLIHSIPSSTENNTNKPTRDATIKTGTTTTLDDKTPQPKENIKKGPTKRTGSPIERVPQHNQTRNPSAEMQKKPRINNVPQMGSSNLPQVETSNLPQVGASNLTQKGTGNLMQKGTSYLQQKGASNLLQPGQIKPRSQQNTGTQQQKIAVIDSSHSKMDLDPSEY